MLILCFITSVHLTLHQTTLCYIIYILYMWHCFTLWCYNIKKLLYMTSCHVYLIIHYMMFGYLTWHYVSLHYVRLHCVLLLYFTLQTRHDITVYVTSKVTCDLMRCYFTLCYSQGLRQGDLAQPVFLCLRCVFRCRQLSSVRVSESCGSVEGTVQIRSHHWCEAGVWVRSSLWVSWNISFLTIDVILTV